MGRWSSETRDREWVRIAHPDGSVVAAQLSTKKNGSRCLTIMAPDQYRILRQTSDEAQGVPFPFGGREDLQPGGAVLRPDPYFETRPPAEPPPVVSDVEELAGAGDADGGEEFDLGEPVEKVEPKQERKPRGRARTGGAA